jgi:hypothetical protein
VSTTPFPGKPVDVGPLTAREFMFVFDLTKAPSLDEICAQFPGDSNRAIVWLIRFRALKSLTDDVAINKWLARRAGWAQDACAVAATLALNEQWEFDRGSFCSAVTARIGNRT